MLRKTIQRSVSCSGVGVHSGAPISLTLNPAKSFTGIVFKRTDIAAAESIIPAHWSLIKDTSFCTKLTNEFGQSASTVEHLMAAFAALGISDAVVEISGPEVPILDGSAAPFIFLIECAGIKTLETAQEHIKILKPISVERDYGFARLLPSETFEADLRLTFPNRDLSAQHFTSKNIHDCFKQDIARARTFGFMSDVEKLKNAGLARGGSLDNAVIFDGETPLNPGGLRFSDECVRHKALDMLGDLYLAGAPIIGKFEGKNSGHTLNADLLKALFSDQSAWELTTDAQNVSIAAIA